MVMGIQCSIFELLIKMAHNVHWVIMEWHPIVGTLMGFIMIFIVNYLIIFFDRLLRINLVGLNVVNK